MPKGPRGEKRPAGMIGNAVRVMQIAGEAEETPDENGKDKAADREDDARAAASSGV